MRHSLTAICSSLSTMNHASPATATSSGHCNRATPSHSPRFRAIGLEGLHDVLCDNDKEREGRGIIDEAERDGRGAASEWRFELADAPTWQVRGMRSAPILLATCIALLAAAWAWPAHAEVSGQARVVDGDSLEIGGARIRLFGIDAPERGQSCQEGGELWICGGLARLRLEERISQRRVVCVEKDRDRYGRIVAVCRAGGKDLNAWMVSEGWALAYRRYSEAYVDEEAGAKAARVGVWRGDFVPPWDWRRGKRLPPIAAQDTRRSAANRGNCHIKGNVSYNRSMRIYHMPGDRDYSRTRIDPSRGERWFCSEAEARAAGWRRADRRLATRDTRVESRSRGGCRIKGNISRHERIYHVPGGHYYGRTRIDTSKGERWFCSEAQARSAGWRRSRR